jgi:hypothetical protein
VPIFSGMQLIAQSLQWSDYQVRFPARQKRILFLTAHRSDLESTQPSIKWVPVALFRGKSTFTHLHTMPWLGMCRAKPPALHVPLCCSAPWRRVQN